MSLLKIFTEQADMVKGAAKRVPKPKVRPRGLKESTKQVKNITKWLFDTNFDEPIKDRQKWLRNAQKMRQDYLDSLEGVERIYKASQQYNMEYRLKRPPGQPNWTNKLTTEAEFLIDNLVSKGKTREEAVEIGHKLYGYNKQIEQLTDQIRMLKPKEDGGGQLVRDTAARYPDGVQDRRARQLIEGASSSRDIANLIESKPAKALKLVLKKWELC